MMASSIFQGMWWAVQTLTSLGYGDFPVQTVLGKLVRSFFPVLFFPVLIELLYSLSHFPFPFSSFFHLQVGSFTAVCGVLVMALPIPIVVDNFADYYSEQKKLEAKELKEEEMAKEAVVILAAAQLAEDSLIETVCK